MTKGSDIPAAAGTHMSCYETLDLGKVSDIMGLQVGILCV